MGSAFTNPYTQINSTRWPLTMTSLYFIWKTTPDPLLSTPLRTTNIDKFLEFRRALMKSSWLNYYYCLLVFCFDEVFLVKYTTLRLLNLGRFRAGLSISWQTTGCLWLPDKLTNHRIIVKLPKLRVKTDLTLRQSWDQIYFNRR